MPDRENPTADPLRHGSLNEFVSSQSCVLYRVDAEDWLYVFCVCPAFCDMRTRERWLITHEDSSKVTLLTKSYRRSSGTIGILQTCFGSSYLWLVLFWEFRGWCTNTMGTTWQLYSSIADGVLNWPRIYCYECYAEPALSTVVPTQWWMWSPN